MWGSWSVSGCGRPDVWNYDSSAQCWYWTQRFGTHAFSRSGGALSIFAAYQAQGYECGPLGPPVKDYGWVSELAAYGVWCEGGALVYRSGRWESVLGDWGQSAGRLAEVVPPADAERPPEHAAMVRRRRPPKRPSQ